MNTFKKQNRFGRGNFGKKTFNRGEFGGDRGFAGRDRNLEMFQATCASCGNTCEVPFRPNGKKPVYCKECFAKNGGPALESRRDFAPRREFSQPAPVRLETGKEMGEMKRQIETLNYKLDKIIDMIGGKQPENTEVLVVKSPVPVAAHMPDEIERKPKKAATKKKK